MYKYSIGAQHHELLVTSNQNQNKIPTAVKKAVMKRQEIIIAGEDVEKREHLCTKGGKNMLVLSL